MPRRPAFPRQLTTAAALLAVLTGASLRAAEKVTFVDNALPVLRQRCGSCHNADKKTAGLDVTSYAGIMAGGGSGEVIVPGDANASHLFCVANHDDEPKMPPDAPPIPEPERQMLRAWIDGGVLENKGSVAAMPVKKVEVAMTAPATARPAVQPLPAHLPLEPVLRTPHLDVCASIATSPWAPLAAVCGQKQVLLYRTDSLELAGVLPFPEGRPHVVKFSAGGGIVLAGGGVGAASGRVVLWNVKSGRRIRTLGDELDVVLAADISPDQRLVAFGGPQRVVRVYAVETGQKLHDLTKHTDWITAAAYSPDGALLATADRAGGVVIWEATSGRDFLTLQAHPASVTGIAWRADSNMVATSCEDGQIRLWELENGNQVKAWGAHGGGAAAVEFVRDGRLVSVGRDKVPKLWKPDGTQERAFEACADVGLAASYCDETNRLLAGDWTGEIRVWNAADGARVGTLDPNPISLADRAAAADRDVAATRVKLEAAEKALAAADPAATEQNRPLEAQVVGLKNDVARAAATHARWLAEIAFQANYDRQHALLTEKERILGQAEADVAGADAKRQADEQARQAAIAKKDGMQKQIETLTAAIAQGEKEMQALTGQIETRGGELAGVQAAIDKSLQAIAVIDESAKSLEKGLAAAPDDAALKQARTGLTAAVEAKRAQLKQEQDSLAALTAEKTAWEKAIVDKRAAGEKHKADIAAVTAAMPAVDADIAAAATVVAESVKTIEEKRSVVTAKQAEVDAAGKQLDALQGIAG